VKFDLAVALTQIDINDRIFEMFPCSNCGRDLGENGGKNIIASISGSIMGDETIETFFFCPACGSYTLEIVHDRFCGETTSRTEGPYTRAEIEDRIALINQCDEPWNKKCRCDAHKKYFDGWLD